MNPKQERQERIDRAGAVAEKVWATIPNFKSEKDLTPEVRRKLLQARIAFRIVGRAINGETFWMRNLFNTRGNQTLPKEVLGSKKTDDRREKANMKKLVEAVERDMERIGNSLPGR